MTREQATRAGFMEHEPLISCRKALAWERQALKLEADPSDVEIKATEAKPRLIASGVADGYSWRIEDHSPDWLRLAAAMHACGICEGCEGLKRRLQLSLEGNQEWRASFHAMEIRALAAESRHAKASLCCIILAVLCLVLASVAVVGWAR